MSEKNLVIMKAIRCPNCKNKIGYYKQDNNITGIKIVNNGSSCTKCGEIINWRKLDV